MKRPFLILTALFALSGCLSVPLTSVFRLSQIDFETTDLAALRVAVQLPETLRPRKGGVRLTTHIQLGDQAMQTTDFLLVPADDAGNPHGLPRTQTPGMATYAYRLSDADVKRLESIRTEVYRKRRTGEHGSLGFGIAAKEFCRMTALGDGPLPVTTYLFTSEMERYVIVTDGYDLRANADVAKGLETLGPC